jgi:predicted nucleic acid-binding protein
MVIVDTTVWIDYLRGNATPQVGWLEQEMTRQRLGITDIILCETLQGIRDDMQFARVRDALLRYDIFSMGGTELALAAAENYRALRAQGITLRKTIDCLIATFCLQNGHTLLHSDKDFEPFEKLFGLPVIHP